MNKLGCCVSFLPKASVALTIVLFSSGCQLYTNPHIDAIARRPAPSTASVDGIVSTETAPSLRKRAYEGAELSAVSGAVTHGPLYFEDSHEDDRTDADGFARNYGDLFRPTYWQGRFLINALLFPVRAVITPPWTVMQSDGHPSRCVDGWQNDAIRLDEATP